MANDATGFGDDQLPPPVSYSSLLLGDDEISGLEPDAYFGFPISSFSPDNTNKMLCFGDYDVQSNVKSVPACNDDDKLPVSKKKRKGPGSHSGAPAGNRRNSNKQNPEEVRGHAKGVKKEKLGSRIPALQQLVSPFGKTDTASVLHDTLGYIGFLQGQVQVLCSSYLGSCPSTFVEPLRRDPVDAGGDEGKKGGNDLRSRGLCLVPTELTLHVADSNGADLWARRIE